MRVTLVAAVARNMVIGSGQQIPWRLSGEQAMFKDLTTGHVLVMGRLTYDSIGRPLPGRTTVVVTRQRDWEPPGGPTPQVVVVHDLDSALRRAAAIDDEIFVVGGEEIYRQAMGRADRMVLTWVDQEPAGDAYFPTFSEHEWTPVTTDPRDGYEVTEYVRSGLPEAPAQT